MKKLCLISILLAQSIAYAETNTFTLTFDDQTKVKIIKADQDRAIYFCPAVNRTIEEEENSLVGCQFVTSAEVDHLEIEEQVESQESTSPGTSLGYTASLFSGIVTIATEAYHQTVGKVKWYKTYLIRGSAITFSIAALTKWLSGPKLSKEETSLLKDFLLQDYFLSPVSGTRKLDVASGEEFAESMKEAIDLSLTL